MTKLNDKRKQQIREWLEIFYRNKWCPFMYEGKDGSYKTACRVCKRLFPEKEMRLFKNPETRYFVADACPCNFLTVKEVIRRAREWVKE